MINLSGSKYKWQQNVYCMIKMWMKILLLTITAAAAIKEIDIEQYPFQVSLEKNGVHSCGGTLVRYHIVLTAEHCVHGFPKENLQVRAGTSLRQKGGQVLRVNYVYEHPDYNPVTLENDIAILELETFFDISPLVIPVNVLHKDNAVADDALGLVIGWGVSSSADGNPTPNLKLVEMPKVSDDKCAEVYSNFNATTMICFGRNGGGEACLSETGGPILVRRMKHIMEQVGIASYGIGCGEIGKPGVFTRVTAFHDFIEKYAWRP
ncbi:hypothetical protein RI129_005534 [Pyrocoelia pectoralis]|uniref:Peptidase S1 domain-containing protein n=1 Tax=Pyrocoelia pectoralis TaxID=417401 RepID=A0AAN7VF02_9COLE